MKDYHKIIATGFLYLVKDGKVLLMRRRNTGYHDGDYRVVSGHVEVGETPRQGVIREAKEEAGIDILPEHLELVHVVSRKSDLDGSERVDFFWKCSVWSGEVTNAEPEKCDEIAWYDEARLPANLLPAFAGALAGMKNGQLYSEQNW